MTLNSKASFHAIAVALVALLFFMASCRGNDVPLVVYAGKGLKVAMDEIAVSFEQETGISVRLIYAGSNSLLSTIRTTQAGDIFVPGSQSYIKDAGDLIVSVGFVAYHTPTIAVGPNKSAEILSFKDVAKSEYKIAVGNEDMAAIGRIADAILEKTPFEAGFRSNIVVTASTVNELIELVINGDVDAALIWRDMLKWEGSETLSEIAIPVQYNIVEEIHVGVLSTAANSTKAAKFLDFMKSDGRGIFLQNGFQ